MDPCGKEHITCLKEDEASTYHTQYVRPAKYDNKTKRLLGPTHQKFVPAVPIATHDPAYKMLLLNLATESRHLSIII